MTWRSCRSLHALELAGFCRSSDYCPSVLCKTWASFVDDSVYVEASLISEEDETPAPAKRCEGSGIDDVVDDKDQEHGDDRVDS